MRLFVSVFLIFLLRLALFSQNPVADFDVIIVYNCYGARIEYENNSISADTFLWYINNSDQYYEGFEPRGSNVGDYRWQVTLIAIGNGMSDTLTKEFEVINTMPYFSMTVSDTNLYAPLVVNFINQSKIREGDTMTVSWDFGDGHSSSQENPIHTYTLPGTYYFTLKGIRNDGCEILTGDIVIVKDTAQKGEFEFISYDNCIEEFETPSCGFEKHYKLSNDSLYIYGYYYGNCGSYKTATIRYSGDTVKIRTWEFGHYATCMCGYCFEIVIPNITQDSVSVLFNNKTIIPDLTNIPKQNFSNSNFNLYPNPANDNLTIYIQDFETRHCEYKILNNNGKVVQKGVINNHNQIRLKNIEKGAYLFYIINRNNNKEYTTKFIKN